MLLPDNSLQQKKSRGLSVYQMYDIIQICGKRAVKKAQGAGHRAQGSGLKAQGAERRAQSRGQWAKSTERRADEA